MAVTIALPELPSFCFTSKISPIDLPVIPLSKVSIMKPDKEPFTLPNETTSPLIFVVISSNLSKLPLIPSRYTTAVLIPFKIKKLTERTDAFAPEKAPVMLRDNKSK